jgi:hypothetical protein
VSSGDAQGWWGRRKEKKLERLAAEEAARTQALAEIEARATVWNEGRVMGDGPTIPELYASDPLERMAAIDMAMWTVFEGNPPERVVHSAMRLQTALVIPGQVSAIALANFDKLPATAFADPPDYIRLVAAGILYSRTFSSLVQYPSALAVRCENKKFELCTCREEAMAEAAIALGTCAVSHNAPTQEFYSAVGTIVTRELDLNSALNSISLDLAYRSCSVAMSIGATIAKTPLIPRVAALPVAPLES